MHPGTAERDAGPDSRDARTDRPDGEPTAAIKTVAKGKRKTIRDISTSIKTVNEGKRKATQDISTSTAARDKAGIGQRQANNQGRRWGGAATAADENGSTSTAAAAPGRNTTESTSTGARAAVTKESTVGQKRKRGTGSGAAALKRRGPTVATFVPPPDDDNESSDDDANDDGDDGASEAMDEVMQEDRRREKRAAKRRRQTAAADEKMAEVRTLAAAAQIIVGIDMSETSPGMTILDRTDRSRPQIPSSCVLPSPNSRRPRRLHSPNRVRSDWSAGACSRPLRRTKRRRIASKILDGTQPAAAATRAEVADVRIVLQPQIVGADGAEMMAGTKTARNEEVTSALMDQLAPFVARTGAAQILVAVEAYAFHKQSSSVTGLAEVGGVMRNKLFRAGLGFVELSPTTIKRWFAGNGTADKPQMWKRFQQVTCNTLPIDRLIPGSFARQIPCPHQDIVDSFAAAFALHRDTVL